jgi:hypothetical protein
MKSVVILIPILLLVFIFALINWVFPILRFSHWMANNIALITILTIPLVISWRIIYLQSWVSKISLSILILPVIAGCFLLQLFAGLQLYNYRDGIDHSFRASQVLIINNSQIVTYQQNLFATTSLGVIVRQERRLLPGLLLVREIYRETPYLMHLDHVELVGTDAIRIVMVKQNMAEVIIPIQRFVWI